MQVCAEDFFGGGDGALCQRCEGSTFLTFLPAFIFGVVALLLVYYLVHTLRSGNSSAELFAQRSTEVLDALERFCEGEFELMNDLQEAKMEEDAAEKLVLCLGDALSKRCPERVKRFASRVEKKMGKMAVKVRVLISFFQMLSGAYTCSMQDLLRHRTLDFLTPRVGVRQASASPLPSLIQRCTRTCCGGSPP